MKQPICDSDRRRWAVNVLKFTFKPRLSRGHETFASADGSDDKMQGGMLRMAALFDHVLRGFFRHANLGQFLLFLRLVFAEMSAEAALAGFDLLHDRFSCS